MKWNELTRSETPWNWREILKKLVINPSNPEQFTQQVKQGFKKMTENMPERVKDSEERREEEEIVDMDELTADETESDESDVDDDETTEEVEDSPEPDSKKE